MHLFRAVVVALSVLSVTEAAWTEWFDGDNPGGAGDFEVYKIYDPPPCVGAVSAVAAECRVKGGGSDNGQVYECTSNGLRCRNDDNVGDCLDYEVRFMCSSATDPPSPAPTPMPSAAPSAGSPSWISLVASLDLPVFVNVSDGVAVTTSSTGHRQLQRTSDNPADFTSALAYSRFVIDSDTITGFFFRVPSQSSSGILGLTTHTGTSAQNLEFSVQLNTKGEVYRNERGVTEGRIGNYAKGTHIGILVSNDAGGGRTVYYLLEDNSGVLRVADTSTYLPTLPMQLVIALHNKGDAVDSITWLSDAAWCYFIVECEDRRICQHSPTCNRGVCEYVNDVDGTSCNDRNSSTAEDACFDGVCEGEHPCLSTDCPDFGPCVSPSRCVATPGSSQGTCYPGFWLADDTPCDDANAATHHDICSDGICRGVPITNPPTQHPSSAPTTSFPTARPSDSPVTESPTATPTAQPQTSTPSAAPSTTEPSPTPTSIPTALPTSAPSATPSVSTPTSSPSAVPTTSEPTTPSPTTSPTSEYSCENVTCEQVECYGPGRCSFGFCYPGRTVTDGTQCDDHNVQTANDTCTNGVCKGTDLCAGVECLATDACKQSGICDRGECTLVFQPDGLNCDDGFVNTVEDQCIGGQCVGTDVCADVTCTSVSQCHTIGDCFLGVCSSPLADEGTGCDDGNASSVDDSCDGNGVCVGIDPCLGVVCEESSCFEAGTCIGGQCTSGAQKAAGTVCDDEITRTTNDQCDRFGQCRGVDLCDMFNITCPLSACRSHAQCWHGRCLEATPVPDGITCDDGFANTDNDQCVNGSCTGDLDKCFGVTCVQPVSQCLVSLCDADSGTCVDVAKSEGTYCNDGRDTTTTDICDGAGKCAGEDLCDFVSCPTLRPCFMHEPSYDNGCFRGVCLSVQVEDGQLCDDDNNITDDDQCIFGTCIGRDKCIGVECEQPDTVCKTLSSCSHGICSESLAVTDGTFCDDNDARTEDECVGGECVSVDLCESIVCEAAPFSCEIRSCFRGNCSVTYEIDGTPCDDGDSNTVDDSCQNDVCVGIDLCEDVTCVPTNECHIAGVCELGTCSDQQWKKTGTLCDDSNNRTDNDACARGVCSGRDLCVGVTCPDADQCHTVAPCFRGTCARTVTAGALCNDNNFNTEDDRCQEDGTCVGVDHCVVDNVVCPRPPQCFIGGDCLHGECEKVVHAEKGTPCDDGNPLTDLDRCENGRCAGINLCLGVSCGEQTACFTPGACAVGRCSNGTNAVDGTGCDDGDSYTDLDECQNGVCVGRYSCPVECINTRNTCNVPACVASECTEIPRENGYLCDDGNAETLNDQCQDGECTGTDLCKDIQCAPRDQCHAQGTCSLGRCTDVIKTDGTPCDDGDATTTSDVCQNGVCNGVDPCAGVTCDVATQCVEASVCALGSCGFPRFKADNTSCNDNNVGTYADVCQQGACVGSRVCLDGCVAFADHQGLSENVAFGLTRPEGSGSGWNAHAVSVQGMFAGGGGVGGVQFTVAQTNKNVVVGLGYGNGAPGYETTAFAMLFSMQGRVLIYESGKFVRDLGVYRRGDVTTISITAEGYVVYKLGVVGDTFNAATTLTSKVQASTQEQLGVEVAIFDAGASVDQFHFLTRQELFCAGVTCTRPSTCHETPECVLGECVEAIVKSDAPPCDDRNETTDQDTCQADGSCVGVDLCIGVECIDNVWCESPPTCAHGVCSDCVDVCVDVVCNPATDCMTQDTCVRGMCTGATPMPNATNCDDGDETTDNDQCDGLGSCIGVDLCIGVECPALGVCEQSHTCEHGSCVLVNEPLNSICDDLIDATTDDTCDGVGNCAGHEYCSELSIECELPDQCHNAVECYQGVCPELPPKQNGTICDDGDALTDNDRCWLGECVGEDLCVTEGVSCDDTDCSSQGTCRNGKCFYDTIAIDNKPCDDGIAGTVSDKCVQGQCVGLDLCDGITCSDDGGQCQEASFCALGHCEPGDPLENGLSCNDGNPNTANDACSDGVCTGVDLCADVQCPPVGLDACLQGDTCVMGQCEITRVPIGGTCDDSDDRTDFDVCDKFGDCAGRDLCLEDSVVCDEPDQCHFPVSCKNGVCPSFDAKPDGTPCDDGEADTVTDVCTNGVCNGVDPCDDVVCPAADDCHHTRECQIVGIDGVCNNIPRTDGTLCDDTNQETIADACSVGRCVGRALTCDSSKAPALAFNNGCVGFDSSNVRWTSFDADADCTCSTAAGVRFSAMGGVSLTPAQCAHLICDDGGFKFTRCTYNGVEASVGSWIDSSNTIQVPRAFEGVLCGLTNISSPISTTTAPATTATGVQRSDLHPCTVDSHVIDWGTSANGIVVDALVNDTVTWMWQGDVPLNVRSSVGAMFNSGAPSLVGTYTETVTEVGSFKFRSDILTWLTGTLVVKPRPSNQRDMYGVSNDDGADVAVVIALIPDIDEVLTTSVSAGGVVQWRWDSSLYDFRVESALCATTEGRPEGALFDSSQGDDDIDGKFSLRFDVLDTFEYQVWLGSKFVTTGFLEVMSGTTTATSVTATSLTLTTQTHTTTTATSVTSATTITQSLTVDLLAEVETDTLVLGGTNALRVVDYPGITNRFSFAFVASLVRGTSGYLFAQCDATGARYVSLYVSADTQKTILFYRARGTRIQRGTRFTTKLATGTPFRLLLAVDRDTATLHVVYADGSEFEESVTLDGNVSPCAAFDSRCYLAVGARVDDGGYVHTMIGTIYTALLRYSSIGALPDAVAIEPPEEPDYTPTSLLENPAPIGGATPLGDGSYTFDGATGYLQVAPNTVTSVGYFWGALIWAKQVPGTSGYIFAKTDLSGSRRFLALYSSASRGLVLYYTSRGRTYAIPFNDLTLSDGFLHSIAVYVSGRVAYVIVDKNRFGRADLPVLPFDDCSVEDVADNNCHFAVGQRMSTTGGAYRFQGSIYSVLINPTGRVSPDAVDARYLDLLKTLGTPSSFSGDGGARIKDFRTVRGSFSLYFNITAWKDTSGYLLSKCNEDGSVRYYSLYGTPTSLKFFYNSDESIRGYETVEFNVNIFDGVEHTMLLSIVGNTAELTFDGVVVSNVELVGFPQDCSPFDEACFLYIGEQPTPQGTTLDTDYFSGLMKEARLEY
eukprot:m.227107 g.227107  ORF g.227107 m.227107 type:complete len:3101 (-) comp33512_c1_seq1:277-9579(-)